MVNKLYELVMFLICVSLPLVTIILLLPIGFIANSGEHAVYITAVDQSNLWGRNYTVWVKTDLSSSQEESYCVDRTNPIVGQLHAAAIDRTPVVIEYETRITGKTWPLFNDWLCSGYVIVGVQQ